jgi:hypothetical protein
LLSLANSILLARLNISLGRQVNYLDFLPLFNVLTYGIFLCAGIAILICFAGLWMVKFKSLPLMLTGLASFTFLVLLFMID